MGLKILDIVKKGLQESESSESDCFAQPSCLTGYTVIIIRARTIGLRVADL